MAYDREALEQEVAKLTEKESIHDIHHHKRVYLIARKIAEIEHLSFNDDVLHASCFLHDTGYADPRCGGDLTNHITYGMDFAQIALLKVGFPEEKIRLVIEAVRVHDNTKPWA
ncbi:MAG: HD domain-containing protein, partial [archaeon]